VANKKIYIFKKSRTFGHKEHARERAAGARVEADTVAYFTAKHRPALFGYALRYRNGRHATRLPCRDKEEEFFLTFLYNEDAG
jgi:hypothetical protein